MNLTLDAKAFERVIVLSNGEYRSNNQAAVDRAGVNSVLMRTPKGPQLIQKRSRPDFEGTLFGGRSIYYDAKTRSDASMSWADYRERDKAQGLQLHYMLERSRYGAICFFLIHWNPRTLKRSSVESSTYVMPVVHGWDYWNEVLAGSIKTLSRDDCKTLGVKVEWMLPARARIARPMWLEAVLSAVDLWNDVHASVRASEWK